MSYDDLSYDHGADADAFDAYEIDLHGSDHDEEDCGCEAGAGNGPSLLSEPSEVNRNVDFRMDAAPPSGLLDRGGVGASRTGPKGVKADYEEAKRNLSNIRLREQIGRERAINQKIEVKHELGKLAASPADDEEEDDDDEEFARYRADKLKQIQFFQANLPSFGSYDRVHSKGEFASLVKQIDPNVFCVCHLYDNSLESCARLHFSMEELAKQFPHVKFVRSRAVDLMPNYSKGGLPTLLVYKGGDLLSSAIRITDALPRQFSDLDVAKLLQAKKILTIPTGIEGSLQKVREFKSDAMKRDEEEARGGPSVRRSNVNQSNLSEDEEAESSDNDWTK